MSDSVSGVFHDVARGEMSPEDGSRALAIIESRPPCFECSKPMSRAIVSGLPAWVCLDDEHESMPADHGALLSWLSAILPFDGIVIVYEPGTIRFARAWWAWFRHGFCE